MRRVLEKGFSLSIVLPRLVVKFQYQRCKGKVLSHSAARCHLISPEWSAKIVIRDVPLLVDSKNTCEHVPSCRSRWWNRRRPGEDLHRHWDRGMPPRSKGKDHLGRWEARYHEASDLEKMGVCRRLGIARLGCVRVPGPIQFLTAEALRYLPIPRNWNSPCARQGSHLVIPVSACWDRHPAWVQLTFAALGNR